MHFSLIPAIAIFLGLIVYGIFFFMKNKDDPTRKTIHGMGSIKSGIWVPVYIVVLSIESYLGESALGGYNIVPYPYDLLMVIIVAIIFYFWATVSGVRTQEIQEIVDLDSQYLKPEDEEFGSSGGA